MQFLLYLSLLANMAIASPESKVYSADKVLVVNVYDSGIITDGRDTINAEDLAQYIRERLFKNYTGTGKMYDKIRIQKSSVNVPTPVMEIVLKEIKSGQKAALAEICMHKFKKSFEELGKKQQRKVEKQFPVLFQSGFDV